MPAAEPNKKLRLIVPFVAGLAGVLIAVGVFTGSKPATNAPDTEAAQTVPETSVADAAKTEASPLNSSRQRQRATQTHSPNSPSSSHK